MTLPEQCQKDKLLVIALYLLVRSWAEALGLRLGETLTETCAQGGVNRTQLYEKKNRLLAVLAGLEWTGVGRPAKCPDYSEAPAGAGQFTEQVLRFQLAHPGAVVVHASGRKTYSDGYIRWILDLQEDWKGGDVEAFCAAVEVPVPTLRSWLLREAETPYTSFVPRSIPPLEDSVNDTGRQILLDHSQWEGSLRDFFAVESKRLGLSAEVLRRVLVLTGVLPARSPKAPRYRGETTPVCPGTILVTDGKELEVIGTDSGQYHTFNWQGIVDQTTACHTAVVITLTECAEGVAQAFEQSTLLLGRWPQILLHDNKPIHQDAALQATVGPTEMLPATPNRGQNKAVIEGEFGKFEQAVGTIYLDDSNPQTLIQSAVTEIIRAYTAGLNHAGRAEFEGRSRLAVLRDSCPDPAQDQAFLEDLRARHKRPATADPLPTQPVARRLLDEGFARLELESLDPQGRHRRWLSARYTPAAIRQALALFTAERAKERLKNNQAHRYLIKLIQSSQEEIDLRVHEEALLHYAETERQGWLVVLEQEYDQLLAPWDGSTPEKALGFCLSEKALFGGILLERAFWLDKLKVWLSTQRGHFRSVCHHIRRMFEANYQDRFQLIDQLVAWEYPLA